MTKPTHASVTEEPCKCGMLESVANDPRSYIVFDPEVGEYHFRSPWPTSGNPDGMASRVIFHCFFCGGAAPPSKRDLLFAVITPEEQARLITMFDKFHSAEEMIEALGAPDEDWPHGVVTSTDEKDGEPPTFQAFHSVEYTRLSETANVRVAIVPTKGIEVTLTGKYIGPDRSEDGTGVV